jgi:UDP-N-acetylmuramate dehydrogenase
MNIIQNAFLKSLNTFNIDALAGRLYVIQSDAEIDEIVSDLNKHHLKHFILGSGSNVLFTKNYAGGIIKNELKGIKIVEEDEDSVIVQAKAGEIWDDFVGFTIKKGYWGLENLSGIPGTIGAAPIQNIGAYGVEAKDTILRIIGFDLVDLEWRILSNADCKFGYRESIFKSEYRNRILITAVDFKLSKTPSPKLQYGALKELESRNIEELTTEDVREAVLKIRSSKLPDPKLLGNAGSFFKNPVIDNELYVQLQKEYPEITCYPLPDGNVKIPAAWLIEQCGFKGKQKGNVGIYEKQPLVIVNYGNATGQEVFQYAREIQAAVKSKFSIEIHYEVQIL